MTNEHSHEQDPAQMPPRFDITELFQNVEIQPGSPEALELRDRMMGILDKREAEILALKKGDTDVGDLPIVDYLGISRRLSNRERQILDGRKIDSDGNFK